MSTPSLLLEAIDLARASLSRSRKKASLACVARRSDGAIVRSTNGRVLGRSPASHAEARCARKLDVGSEVFVARVLRDGTPAMARPCGDCAGMLRARGVVRVVYTTNDGWEEMDP